MKLITDISHKAKNLYIMAEFQTLKRCYSGTSRMVVAQILQGLSYKVCSTILQKFFAFGLSVQNVGILPLCTRSLLLCHEDIEDSSIQL